MSLGRPLTRGDLVLIQFPFTDLSAQKLRPDFRTKGLKNTSLIRLNKLATLHRGLVRRRIGRIGPATQRTVARALRYVFEI